MKTLELSLSDHQIEVKHEDLRDILGIAREKDHYEGNDVAGVVTGLAWTPRGGDILFIESSLTPGTGKLTLTGNLGDVMKESAEIAYSYVVAHLRELGCDEDFFDMSMVHLHVPEGATPKDGPSAGITMATALVSLARRERIRQPLAMTGELTLTGRVLAVGGIREKVIAARRAKISELILPLANRADYEELPDYLQDGLIVHFVRSFREVFDVVFDASREQRQLH